MRYNIRIFFFLVLVFNVMSGQSVFSAETPEQILKTTGVQGGLVVHLGCGDGKRTSAFHVNDRYLVHGLDANEVNVANAQKHIQSLNLYGVVSVERLIDGHLPYAENLVNLVVVEDLGAVTMAEVMRVLAPLGVAYIKQDGKWKKTIKPWPDNIDEWTHYLHDASGNAVAHDTVIDEPRHIQWVAGPKWVRNHDYLNSISAVVTTAGRIFSIVDRGGRESVLLPSKWFLVAQDAFNGIELWKKPIDSWLPAIRMFRVGPQQISRRLVAKDDKVFVTLGLDAEVVALDAATGEVVKKYEGTENTEEIIHSDGVLLLAVGKDGMTPTKFRIEYTTKTVIVALNAETGEVLWEKPADTYYPLTLSALDNRVCFKNGEEIVCVDKQSGSELWRSEQQVQPLVQKKNLMWSGTEWFSSTLILYKDVILYADGKLVTVSSIKDGKKLWDTPCDIGYKSSTDLFVAGGLVWVGTTYKRKGPAEFTEGRDPLTGEVKKKFKRKMTGATGATCSHHRCYRAKATDKYILWGRVGVRFDSVERDASIEHSWIRGTCQYGLMPANGLLYVPSHSCTCIVETKLNGFYVLSSALPGEELGPAPKSNVLEKGPAYNDMQTSSSSDVSAGDWPTYRHDSTRSGYSASVVDAQLKELWKSKVDGKLSSIVVAGGRLYVSSVDKHTIHSLDAKTGDVKWSRIVAGRVDSPPSVYGDFVLFGGTDGHVYCLRASDGELVWRFRAGPEDRRIMSYGRLESAWPIHGSVLLDIPSGAAPATVCFAAGRTSLVDGGIRVYKLDLKSGKEVVTHCFYGIDLKTKVSAISDNMRARAGILSGDSTGIYMRHLKMNKETLKEIPSTPHLHSASGFLDDTWFHRTYWLIANKMGSNYNGWMVAGNVFPSGRILVFDESIAYGYGRTKVKNNAYKVNQKKWTGSGGIGHQLFAVNNSKVSMTLKEAKRTKREFTWKRELSFTVRAMVLAGDVLFVAGPKGDYREEGTIDSGNGVALMAVSKIDGKTLAEYELDAMPVLDGMIVADGRLYIALKNGSIVCMDAK